jgi:hypothetical protein
MREYVSVRVYDEVAMYCFSFASFLSIQASSLQSGRSVAFSLDSREVSAY